jgi:ATP-dependent 26S proteasome regulatory subunit
MSYDAHHDTCNIWVIVFALDDSNSFLNNFLQRYLPREVDPLVYNMSTEDPGDITYAQIGGLGEQIRELREVLLLTK